MNWGREEKKYLDIVINGKDALEITKTEAVGLRKYLYCFLGCAETFNLDEVP